MQDVGEDRVIWGQELGANLEDFLEVGYGEGEVPVLVVEAADGVEDQGGFEALGHVEVLQDGEGDGGVREYVAVPGMPFQT